MLNLAAEFPILQDQIFFNHAAVAPLPTRSAESLRRWSHEAQTRIGEVWPQWSAALRRARENTARLIGADPDDVAFVHNTTHGLLCIAHSLNWRPGDNVVFGEHEFPANVYPWKNLAPLGVAYRVVPERDRRFRIDDFLEAMDRRTRLVSVSLVQYSTGFRMPVEALAQACRERGVLLCVDGIQGVGALPIDVGRLGCDFLVADGHKWLLGPEGFGLLYVRPEILDTLNTSMAGWAGREHPGDYENVDQPLKPGAIRFGEGSHAMALAAAFGESVGLLQEIGITEVWSRIEALNAHLAEGLERLGFKVQSPRGEGERSGIVSFQGPPSDPRSWVHRLNRERIYLTARRGWLRSSLHFYNNPDQVDRVLAALESLRAGA